MIKELRLQNFRCFEDHTIPLNPSLTVIVGPNNAGKSTIVEALRLISIVGTRYQHLNYRDVPEWLELPRRMRGVSPDIRDMEFGEESTFFQYADPPSIVTATFSGGERMEVYLGSRKELHAVLIAPNGNPLRSRTEANRCPFPQISIMPQVGPVARKEMVLSPDYVRRAMSSPLAPLHFRNQLRVFERLFGAFKTTAEETWSGLRILELSPSSDLSEEPLFLLVQNEGFVADISAMGHGLQMWLQTIWFLVRSKGDVSVILDEPDVYMHADLQRRLIRFLRNEVRQTIVTTHSVEIMAEVEPEEILVVDRARPSSTFATSNPAVQRLAESIGSIHNLHLSRLWAARKCLLVEGKDIKLLKRFQNILFPGSPYPIDAIPNMSIGGWGGWNYAIGSSMILQNAGGEDIVVYCILDRDYHSEDEIADRRAKAKERNVQLHIWSRKEIENYLIVPKVVERAIRTKTPRRTTPPSLSEIENKIDEITGHLKDEIFDALSAEFLARDRKRGAKGANEMARKLIASNWGTFQGRLSLVPGKELISRLSAWSQREFGVSLNALLLARAMDASEVQDEARNLLTAIENSSPLADNGAGCPH